MVKCLCDYGLFADVLDIYQTCRILGCVSDNYTFPFVIKACSALGAFVVGKEIHCLVLRTGFGDNLVVQTALVDLYAKNGQMRTARLLLDRIAQPDLVPWNALISGYSLDGLYQEVFEVFREICEKGLSPNVSTLASVISVCSRLENIDIGKSLHGFASKSGYITNETLTPALISMYAGGGDLSLAINLFDCLPKKSATIWNAMISAYTRNQKFDDAFELFQKMLRDSKQPNMVSFVSIIPSCESSDSIWQGESLHALVIKNGFENQLSVATALLSMYAKLGDLNTAEFLFDQMPHRNLLSWNSMVSAYVQNDVWDASLSAFREMLYAGFDPDAISVVSILSSCSELEATLLGKSAHAFSVKKGIDSNLNVSNALLAFYCNCHQLTYSFKLFHEMAIRNVVSWNSLISGCVQNGEAKEAVFLVHQMQEGGMDFDLVTLVSVVTCYGEIKNLVQGMALHGYAIKAGLASDATLANAFISMYLNCGELDGGRLQFDDMPNKNVVSWNALITGYRLRNLRNEVIDLFGQMIKEDQKPNHVSLLNLLWVCYTHLQACVQLNNLNLANCVMAHVIHKGFEKDVAINNALIDLYARCGNITFARKLFDGLFQKDSVSWSVMINGYGLQGDGEAAIALLSQMRLLGLKPDDITYVSLLSACSHAGLVGQSNMIFNSMVEHGIMPRMEHYACMVDLLGRTGHLNEAYNIVKGLPLKPYVSLLESLLGACLMHSNVELGEEIGGLLLEMDPQNSVPYVILHNIYAAAGRWTDANKVRSNMDGKQLRKVPGFSLYKGHEYHHEQ
ncbi:unnamed protein product [Ilex paraguariensis]|uniref:Pentatricopeptide repeat-containing protein n=1 Tax=Ilex paraguariensis TaxID=185542 RepID=A0ABC8TGZ9_9AQUA